MIPTFLQDWLEKEAYKHPAFFMVAIISFGAVGGVWFNPFVVASDFQAYQQTTGSRLSKLEVAVCTVQDTIEKTSLESQMRDVSTEIFQLERIVAAQDATERDKDRLDDLRNDMKELDTRMEEYLRRRECAPDHNGAGN